MHLSSKARKLVNTKQVQLNPESITLPKLNTCITKVSQYIPATCSEILLMGFNMGLDFEKHTKFLFIRKGGTRHST